MSLTESSIQDDEDDEEADSRSDSAADVEDVEENDEYSSTSMSDDHRESSGQHAGSSGKCVRRPLRERVTTKAVPQAGERFTLPALPKVPCRPMLELESGSNIWFQAYVLKESLNEVKVRFPAADSQAEDTVEWVRKVSSRIWRGSYRMSSWKYLGKGAWAPRKRQQRGVLRRRKPQPAMRKRRPARERSRKIQLSSSGMGSPDLSEESAPSDRSDGETMAKEQGRKQLEEEEIMSPQMHHGVRLRTAHELPSALHHAVKTHAGHEPLMHVGGEKGSSSSLHTQQKEQVIVKQEDCCQGDRNSAKSCSDDFRSAFCQADDDEVASCRVVCHDPLAKWFEIHFLSLKAAGKLGMALPCGTPESGVLPEGFCWDPESKQVLDTRSSSTQSTAVAVGRIILSGQLMLCAGQPQHAGSSSACNNSSGIDRKTRKRVRDEDDSNSYDGNSGYHCIHLVEQERQQQCKPGEGFVADCKDHQLGLQEAVGATEDLNGNGCCPHTASCSGSENRNPVQAIPSHQTAKDLPDGDASLKMGPTLKKVRKRAVIVSDEDESASCGGQQPLAQGAGPQLALGCEGGDLAPVASPPPLLAGVLKSDGVTGKGHSPTADAPVTQNHCQIAKLPSGKAGNADKGAVVKIAGFQRVANGAVNASALLDRVNSVGSVAAAAIKLQDSSLQVRHAAAPAIRWPHSNGQLNSRNGVSSLKSSNGKVVPRGQGNGAQQMGHNLHVRMTSLPKNNGGQLHSTVVDAGRPHQRGAWNGEQRRKGYPNGQYGVQGFGMVGHAYRPAAVRRGQ